MKPVQAKKQLLEIEDKVAKICIGYGEKRIPKDQFDSACRELNERQLKILVRAKMI